MVTVEINTVDGGYQKYEEDEQFLNKLQTLQARGNIGKKLIHALIGDDWGAPPLVVVIKWSKHCQNFTVTIPYD